MIDARQLSLRNLFSKAREIFSPAIQASRAMTNPIGFVASQAPRAIGNFVNNVSQAGGLSNFQAQNRQAFNTYTPKFQSGEMKLPVKYDVPLGFGRGVAQGQVGFTGLENRIAPNLYNPTSTAGKVAQTVGGIAGYTIGVGKFLNPLEGAVAAKVGLSSVAKSAPFAQRVLNTVARKTIPATLAETASSVPLAIAESINTKRPISQTIPQNIGAGLTGRVAFGALPLIAGGLKNVNPKLKVSTDPLAEARKYKSAEKLLQNKSIPNPSKSIDWIKNVLEKNADEKTTRHAIDMLSDEKANPNTRMAFELVTGLKLPKNVEESRAFLEQMAGIEITQRKWMTRKEVVKNVELLKGKFAYLDNTKRSWLRGNESYAMKETPVKIVGISGNTVEYKYKDSPAVYSQHIDNIRDIKVDGKSILSELNLKTKSKLTDLYNQAKAEVSTDPLAEARKYKSAEELGVKSSSGKYTTYNPKDVFEGGTFKDFTPSQSDRNYLETISQQAFPADQSISYTKIIPIELLDNTSTNARGFTGNAENIDGMVRTLKNGGELPPIIVQNTPFTRQGEKLKFGIFDGATRLEAYKKAGIKEVKTAIITSSEDFTNPRFTDLYNQAKAEVPTDGVGVTTKVNTPQLSKQLETGKQIQPLKLVPSGQTATPQVADTPRILSTPGPGIGREQILSRIAGNQGSTRLLPRVSQGLETPKASSGSIVSLKPRTALLKQAEQLEQLGEEPLAALKESAESATNQRSFFNKDQIKDINKFKQFAKSNEILEGDVETMRKKIPNNLTDKVLEYVEENLGIRDEEKALDILLNLPTKLDTKVRMPEEIRMAKELRARAKQVIDLVFNSETDLDVKDKVIKNNLQDLGKDATNNFRDWQSQLFKQEGASRMTPNRLANRVALSIKQSTTPTYAKEVLNLKDISEPGKGMTDVYRNFDRVFGHNSRAKKEILEPFDTAKSAVVDDLETIATNLRKNVVDKYNFQKGSRESAAIQQYGERLRDYNSLVQEFGKSKADNIVQADKWFRSAYDELLSQVNEVRRKIYPNSPDKIIPRRSDYYRHFKDLSDTFSGLKNLFETPAGIDPVLAGMSEYVKPKSKWLSFAQQRLGIKTEYDAVGGFLEYAQAQTYSKRIDPFIDKFRQLRTELVDATSDANAPEYGKLNNFIEFLDDYANDLAGKTNPADRALQKYIGRKPFRILNWINSRTKANVILGNLSSAVAQFFNIPQGIAEAGIDNSGRGALRYLSSILKPDKAMAQSQFLKTRLKNPLSQFDVGALASAKKTAVAITQFGDEVGTRYIWSSLYEKALKNGVSDPIKYADDITRKMVAGRGIGEVPLLQKSKVFQLVAPFQLEVSNIWHVMRDWAGEKQAGKFVTFFIASYLMNNIAKRIRGNDVSFDPIGAGVDAVQTAEEAENPQGALMLGVGRMAGEILSNVPFGQTLAGIYPEFGGEVLGVKLPTREKLFGEGDPTRFGSGLLAASSFQDPLTKLVPPFGGRQVKRTIEGLKSVVKGYSESQSGRVRFPVEKNLRNTIQAGAFGQYSTPEARKYFDSNTSTLGDKQSQAFKSILDSQGIDQAKAFYNSIINKRGKGSTSESMEPSTDLDVIKTKLDNTPDLVTPQEIATYYESKVTKPTSSSGYQQAIYEKDIWSQVSNINQRDSLTDQQKDDASMSLLGKIGINPQDYQYYTVAKQVNDLKSMYAEEELTKMMASGASRDDIYQWLIDNRREVNGSQVLTSGVIDSLVDKEIISYADGKSLKNLKVSGTGVKQTRKSTKKLKVAKPKKISVKAIKVPKVKLVKAKTFKAPKVARIRLKKAKKLA